MIFQPCPECGRRVHRADCAAVARRVAQRAALPPAPGLPDTSADSIAPTAYAVLHGPAEHAPNEMGGAPEPTLDADGLSMPATRADEAEAEDRAARGRDGRRIRVPARPLAATHESVQAEHRAMRSAARMLARKARWTVDADGFATPDVPEAESERALDVPERAATPRGIPKRQDIIMLRLSDGSIVPFPRTIY